MATSTEVTVFVDDAVRGTLPPVCARDGVPTTDHLRHHQPVADGARLGAAWLLLLAGPLGWIALAFITGGRGGGTEVLSVTLPWSEPAYQRQLAATRERRRAGWAAAASAAVLFVGVLSGYLGRFPTPVETLAVAGLVAGGAWALVLWFFAAARVEQESVTISLDASRRWVTLGGVHPDFAAAVRARDDLEHAHR